MFVYAENKLQLAQLAEQFNEYNVYDNLELDKDIQKMESQSVKIDRYLAELEIHGTTKKSRFNPFTISQAFFTHT